MEHHAALQTQENLRAGMAPAELKLGVIETIRDDYHEEQRLLFLENLLQDVRYALRQFRLSPVFAITVILTLGLGIGATTAIFSLIHAVMLKSLPVADPSHLYQIGVGSGRASGVLQGDWEHFSYSLYKRIATSTPQFDDIAASQRRAGILSVRDSSSMAQARPLLGEYVSGNYFRTFGLRAYAGRLLTPEDDQRNAAPVAVLSYRTWLRDYNANPSVIGTTIKIETYPFTIVGVAPQGFFGETLSSTPTEIWISLEAEYLIDGKAAFNLLPSQAWLHLIGHLRPGARVDGVQDQLTATLHHWLTTEAALPPQSQPQSAQELARQVIRIAPGGAGIGVMRDTYGDSLRLLFALCLAVLLIACANVANLLLGRGIAQRAQISLQLALGATRSRILRQKLTECAVLALAGGAAGVAIGWLGAKLVITLAFGHASAVPLDVRPSWPVLFFCLGLSLMTGVAFGVLPAWLLSRADPIESLRSANRSTSTSTVLSQKLLVMLQVMLSILLITTAGMLIRSIANLQNQDLGFRTENRLSVSMEPPLADYTLDQLTLRYRDLRDRLLLLPGVHNASLALDGPTDKGWTKTIVRPGEDMPREDGSQSAGWNRVSPGYFETIGLPIIAGRGILDSDRIDTPGVAVVNEAFARKFFGNRPPLGQHFGIGLPAYANTLEVVGVVRDTKSGNLREAPQPMAFGALTQRIAYREEMLQASDKWDHFINGAQILFSGDAGVLEPRIREAFRVVDPNFAIINIQPLQQLVDVQLDQQDTVAELSGLFGILALILATVGLYGVTAWSVARRTQEIGIRIAVGANRLHIVALILRGAFTQVAIGVTLGLPASFAAGKLLSSKLYHVGALDPPSMMTAISALLLATGIACFVPARRAVSTDPVRTLRAE